MYISALDSAASVDASLRAASLQLEKSVGNNIDRMFMATSLCAGGFVVVAPSGQVKQSWHGEEQLLGVRQYSGADSANGQERDRSKNCEKPAGQFISPADQVTDKYDRQSRNLTHDT
jgi:hypothetical protein